MRAGFGLAQLPNTRPIVFSRTNREQALKLFSEIV